MDYELFEQRLTERLAEVERTVHAATLAALDLDAEHVLINDKLHARGSGGVFADCVGRLVSDG